MCKKLICLISFVVMLALAGNAVAQIDPASVDTGHVYLFEDVSGGQVQDDSANSLAGTIVGDPQVVGGLKGDALQFDGVDDGVDIPDSQFINDPGGPWPNRTVVAMFKCDDVDKPGKQTVYEQGGTTRGMTIYVSEGLVYGAAWNRAEYNWNGAWLTAPIESGNWYGVAIVIRDGAEAVEDDKFEMWVNGQLVAKAPGGQIHNHGNDTGIGYTNQNNVFHDGNASPADGHYFGGAIDEIWILSAALTQVELGGFAGKVWPFAFGPTPADGSFFDGTWGNLFWTPGGFAVSHDVYIGENFDDVNNGAGDTFVGNQSATDLIIGFPGLPFPDGLVPGTTYYWRIDEVNEAE
ncbi:MAG: LamG-like jellyroll fold domain-containing protein, partial [Planctomycetota bacterium]